MVNPNDFPSPIHGRPLYSLNDVVALTGVSRSTIYAWVDKGFFPVPRRLGDRTTRWLGTDLAAWIDALPPASEENLG